MDDTTLTALEALRDEWKQQIDNAPRHTDYLRGYWNGRATAHNDLDAIIRRAREEAYGGQSLLRRRRREKT